MRKAVKRFLMGALALFATAILGIGTASLHKQEASAAGLPSLRISGHTLSLKDNIHIKYAVESYHIESATAFGLLVWDTPQERYEYGTQTEILSASGSVVQNGIEYPTFEYCRLFARNMTEVIYSRAYAIVDGECYYSEVNKYSILEYAYNKLGYTEDVGTTDESLINLLESMLDYGGNAQIHFNYKADEPANGDFSYVRFERGLFPDGFYYGIYKVGTKVQVKPDEDCMLSEEPAEYMSCDANGDIYLTVPETMTVDTVSFVDLYSKGLTYALNTNKDSYRITGIGTCTDTELILPSTYKGLPITTISGNAFSYCRNITSVFIPENIRYIGENAFYFCEKLANLTIPDNIERIEEQAFFGCNSLTQINLSKNVSYIGEGAFANCGKLTAINVDPNNATYQSIDGNLYTKDGTVFMQYAIAKTGTEFTIPEKVTAISGYAFSKAQSLYSVHMFDGVLTIGEYAFVSCSNLKAAELSKKVTTIGSFAFNNCAALPSINVPASVTSIGTRAFMNCNALTAINVDASNANYQSIDGNLYTKDGTTLIQYAIGKTAADFYVPDTVTTIEAYAFYRAKRIRNLKLNAVSIGTYAFYDCDLTTVIVQADVTTIAASAFYSCDYVSTVYYEGTADDWTNMTIGSNNDSLTEAKRYYYRATKPNEASGDYWYYNENKQPTVWSYTLTVNYVYKNGGTAAASYEHPTELYNGSAYEVVSPEVKGHTAAQTSVSGVMGAGDVEITVTYNPNVYTITYCLCPEDTVNSSSLSVTTKKVTYGTAIKLDVPTNSFYTFGGWYSTSYYGTEDKVATAGGSLIIGTSYTDNGGKWIYAGNVKLHAKWTKLYTNYTYIGTVGQLKAIESTGKYMLVKNITLSDTWTPLGKFSGELDGNGFTIKGLASSKKLSDSGESWGLFSNLNGATVTDIKFTEVAIAVDNDVGNGKEFRVGALAGEATGTTIKNITVSGSVKMDGSYSGGSIVGGVVGRAWATTFTGCTNNASVHAAKGSAKAGGIVGYLEGTSSSQKGALSNCKNTGAINVCVTVSSGYGHAGGIAGLVNKTYATVSDCNNSGTITANRSVLIAYLYKNDIHCT